jgi:hypothetical protein
MYTRYASGRRALAWGDIWEGSHQLGWLCSHSGGCPASVRRLLACVGFVSSGENIGNACRRI